MPFSNETVIARQNRDDIAIQKERTVNLCDYRMFLIFEISNRFGRQNEACKTHTSPSISIPRTTDCSRVSLFHRAHAHHIEVHRTSRHAPFSTGFRPRPSTTTATRTTMKKRISKKRRGRQTPVAHGPQPGVGGVLCQ